MSQILKTYKKLKEKKIENLEIATQEAFDNFVNDVLIFDITKERIKRAPSILYIGNLNEELANLLGLSNVKVYIRKNELHHTREERKGEYNQDVPVECFKNLPNLIANATEAYVDSTEKHRNFFLVEDLDKKEKFVAAYHFNKDKLGNYFVTARRIEKAKLAQGEYELVRSGIAPHIQEHNEPTLLTRTSLTNSNADNITNKQISQAQETTDFKQVVENPNPQSDKDYIIGKQLNDRKMGDVGIRNDEGTNVIFHANEKRIGSLKSHIKKKIVAIDGRDALTPYTQAQSLDGRLVQKNISSTATANTIPNPTLNNTETTNLKQITRDTAVLAPQSSALLIKTYEQLGEERLAHTLISTIETDKITMQEVSKEYMNLSENNEAMIQSSEWVDENKNSQESDKNIKTTPKPKIKTMFGKKNNGENND